MGGLDFEKYKTVTAKKEQAAKKPSNCESCVHYDYDEELDSYVCGMNLDEDELVNFLNGNAARCPYYRFYDEYKSVQKQN
jgi:hypothetical protein